MNVLNSLNQAENLLKKNNIESYKYDASELLAFCMNKPRISLLLNKDSELTSDQYNKFFELIKKRINHIPLQHLLHSSNFYGLDLYVNKDVLIPRFETELLCEQAIKTIGNQSLSVLDLCTGSGCIAIAIAKHCPNALVSAIDISDEALNVAKINQEKNNVRIKFIKNDLMNGIKEKYDIIISNPPYIKSSDIDSLQEEVKHDPILALDGGSDGLEVLKRIVHSENIHAGTLLMLEIGYDQSRFMLDIMSNYYINIRTLKDYNGYNRFIIAERGTNTCLNNLNN